MAITLGNNNLNKVYLGGVEIKKLYLGNTIVFNSESGRPNKMTIESIELS